VIKLFRNQADVAASGLPSLAADRASEPGSQLL